MPKSYNSIPIHAAPGLHEWICDYLKAEARSGKRILELGAGAGALTARLADAGFDVTPVDVDASKWSYPAKSLTLQDLDRDSWDALGEPGSGFDVVLAVEVIEHLENPSAFVRHALRYVRKGGLLVVSTPNVTSPYSALTLLCRRTLFCFSPSHLAGTGHISIVPWWLITHLFEANRLALKDLVFVGRHDAGVVHAFGNRCVAAVMRLFTRPAFPVVDDGLVTVAIGAKA